MRKLRRRIAEFLVLRIWPYPLSGLRRFRGCCGCGNRFADVVSPPCPGAPNGEGYCWECAITPHEPLKTAYWTILTAR